MWIKGAPLIGHVEHGTYIVLQLHDGRKVLDNMPDDTEDFTDEQGNVIPENHIVAHIVIGSPIINEPEGIE